MDETGGAGAAGAGEGAGAGAGEVSVGTGAVGAGSAGEVGPGADERAALLADAQPYCLRHALALAGADALRLHGLAAPVHGTDLLLVTGEGPPLADLATGLAETLRAAGHYVQEPPGTARRCQLTVTVRQLPLAVELGREPLRHPPVLPVGATVPVAALDDVAALAVRTLCERALPADLYVLHALTAQRREGELLALAEAFDSGPDEDTTARTLADRLETAAALLPPEDPGTRRWAEAWAQDLRLDLLETTALADGLHDPYLEHLEPAEPAEPDPADGPATGPAGPPAGPPDDL
ncbi:hypothetical protein ABZ747_20980 [Kitasatospora cineracea]|uniref:hypothetical protein n=1 Tax=Kitasatospora cineracea TaxID=88074 RepID=UPI0033C52103